MAPFVNLFVKPFVKPRRFFSLPFWAVLAWTSLAAAGAAFVAGFEDLPLMPGLANVADAGVVFDTPSGRIVEAVAQGESTPKEVLAFYARTLPQLGWDRFLDTEYRREGEVLRLEIEGDGPEITVRYFLSPG